MPYSSIADYLQANHPREYANDSASGSVYLYRGPTATISANVPVVGETWADGRPVVSVESFAYTGASAISELTVITAENVSYAGGFGTPAVEEEDYELEWRPVVMALEAHPDFRASGTYALDATARKHIIGWRAELDADLKSQRKYKPLDSSGTPGAEVTISGNALEYIKLCEVGVEEYVHYMPVWRKRSHYRGSVAPGTSSIGVKTTTPSGSGYPSGYEWVKSRDSARRVGRSSKWIRDEEWEGAIKVFADKNDVFPP